MIHFQYLTSVEGGLLHQAPDLDTHLAQLAAAVALDGSRDERNRRFVGAFLRPFGIERPATPVFAAALEQMAQRRVSGAPVLAPGAFAHRVLRPVAMRAAAWSRSGAGRYLMNDMRNDAWDAHADKTARSVEARRDAKAARQKKKARRREWVQRRDAVMRLGKEVKSATRKARHRTAVTVYRALHLAGLWRGELPGGTGED
jgi:hypothetical protein